MLCCRFQNRKEQVPLRHLGPETVIGAGLSARPNVLPCPAGQNYLEGDNIKNIISHAFDDAYDLLAELGVNIVLEKKR
jgi:hypothetical protein